MTAQRRVSRPARWLLPIAVALALALGTPLARAQDGTPDAPPAPEAPTAAANPAPASPDAPTGTAASTTAPTAPPATTATGASCSGAYGLNADNTGRYATTGCAATGGSSAIPANGVPVVGPLNAPPCQLYPSSDQPTTSSLSAPAPGAPLTTATSFAPPCPATTSSRGSLTGGGVPACQLYPSANQPSSSTFGAANYPVTPLPAPAQVAAPRGTLAGAGC